MSGLYTDNVVNRMPITWLPGGKGTDTDRRRGQTYAIEGDAKVGYVFLVITEEQTIEQVHVATDKVRLDTKAIEAAEAKVKSQIIQPPRGSGDRRQGQTNDGLLPPL